MIEAILEIKNLIIGHSGKPLGSPINIKLPKGCLLGILGTNGSGKTTLLKTLLGLNAPVSGSCRWMGAVDFGFVPQENEIDPLFPLTVRDVLAMGAPRGTVPGDFAKMLIDLEIESLEKKLFRELSGGQKQRVLLGRALMGRPNVVLLDEPFNNLDYGFRTKLLTRLSEWERDRGWTVLLIEHDINRIVNDVDYMILLGPHRSLAGPTRELANKEILEAVYEAPLHIHEEDGKLQIHFL